MKHSFNGSTLADIINAPASACPHGPRSGPAVSDVWDIASGERPAPETCRRRRIISARRSVTAVCCRTCLRPAACPRMPACTSPLRRGRRSHRGSIRTTSGCFPTAGCSLSAPDRAPAGPIETLFAFSSILRGRSFRNHGLRACRARVFRLPDLCSAWNSIISFFR